MKKLIPVIIFSAILPIYLSTALGNGQERGGGRGYLFKDGSVRLVDTVGRFNITQIVPDHEVQKLWSEDKKCYKQAHTLAPHFFDNAASKFKEFSAKFPILNELSNTLKMMNPYLVEYRLIDETLPQINSEKFGQQLIAKYDKSDLLISKRLYQKMSPAEKDYLACHEAFRHLNHIHYMRNPLDEDEVMIATRYFCKNDLTTDSNEQRGRVFAKLAQDISVMQQRDCIVQNLSKNYSDLADLNRQISLATKKQKTSKKMDTLKAQREEVLNKIDRIIKTKVEFVGEQIINSEIQPEVIKTLRENERSLKPNECIDLMTGQIYKKGANN